MEHSDDADRMQAPGPLAGIWLSADPVHASVEALVLEMLEPNFPNPVLRGATVEELARGVKLADVVVESLGLRTVSVEEHGGLSARVVAPQLSRDPWREALVAPGGGPPVGLVVPTAGPGPPRPRPQGFARFPPT